MKIKDVILGSALLGATFGQAQNEVAASTSKDLNKTMIRTNNQQSHAEDTYTFLPGEETFRAQLKTSEQKALGKEILDIAQQLYNQSEVVQNQINQENRDQAYKEAKKLYTPGEKMRTLIDKLIDTGANDIVYDFGDQRDIKEGELNTAIINGEKRTLDNQLTQATQEKKQLIEENKLKDETIRKEREETAKEREETAKEREETAQKKEAVAQKDEVIRITNEINLRYKKTVDGTNKEEIEEFKNIEKKYGKEKIKEIINQYPDIVKKDIHNILTQSQ